MSEYTEKNTIVRKPLGYLPDLCDSNVFLRALLAVELIAIAFALVSYQDGSFYVHIALISVFMLWVGLCVAATLCWIKRLGWLKTAVSTTIWSISLTILITLLITWLGVALQATMSIFGQTQDLSYLLIRNAVVSVILIGLALRYFYLEFETMMILQVQAQARLQALQARIRPHFLFNSMNTIASLTHDEPDLAERSIENLSDLFRASLAAKSSVSLQQELELTRGYVELESLRLGGRLQVNWSVPSPTPQLSLPALTLQPLVENAIYHGVEPIHEGGTIEIIVRPGATDVEIIISNPVLEDRSQQHRDGNQMAVDNIRERLNIAFAGAASMQLSEVDELFTVVLVLPIKTAAATA
ncbi:MAG: sensor histidine kinase [Gammaproteobacteria bacterium]|nr:sensor histidine kinase [Gammaproteobacteria bacterium]